MTKYVDGFVLVIPKDKEANYKKIAELGRDLWIKHGALGYYECKGNELAPAEMGGEKANSFIDLTNAKPDEDVWFSFIIFKDKSHRDEVNKKVMEEMSQHTELDMPFDMQRMSYGGFQVEVEKN